MNPKMMIKNSVNISIDDWPTCDWIVLIFDFSPYRYLVRRSFCWPFWLALSQSRLNRRRRAKSPPRSRHRHSRLQCRLTRDKAPFRIRPKAISSRPTTAVRSPSQRTRPRPPFRRLTVSQRRVIRGHIPLNCFHIRVSTKMAMETHYGARFFFFFTPNDFRFSDTIPKPLQTTNENRS